MPDIMIIGHRGAMAHELENSMSSFEKAIEMGAHMLEMDVHATIERRYCRGKYTSDGSLPDPSVVWLSLRPTCHPQSVAPVYRLGINRMTSHYGRGG